MHVGPGEFNVSQCGRFERAIYGDACIRADRFGWIRISPGLFLAAVGQWAELGVSSTEADIFVRGSYSDVVKASIVVRSAFFHGHEFDQATISEDSTQFADRGAGKFGTAVAVDAFTGPEEDFQAFFGLGAECCFVSTGEVIEGCLIRDQGGLVHHECESPVEREVCFHLCVAICGNLFRRPPFRAERGSNKCCVAGFRGIKSLT